MIEELKAAGLAEKGEAQLSICESNDGAPMASNDAVIEFELNFRELEGMDNPSPTKSMFSFE